MLPPLRPIAQSAYRHWFLDLPSNSMHPPMAVLKRWWGVNVSKEEGAAFDQSCSDLFRDALQEIQSLPAQSKQEREGIARRLLKDCTQDSPVETYKDTLGLIILLDQMARNVYRGDSASLVYSHFDPITQVVARDALQRGVDGMQNADQLTYRQWFYMPLMHSEDIEQHRKVWQVYSDIEKRVDGNEEALKYVSMSKGAAAKHYDIIKEFGRYPHRNECLKRKSTPAEEKWLAEGGTYH
jgi:uncharacterized protein (DUF924 family)